MEVVLIDAQAHTHTHAQVHGLDCRWRDTGSVRAADGYNACVVRTQGEECSRSVDIGAQGEGKDGREERGGAAVPPDVQS
jgi:hypothetical protein